MKVKEVFNLNIEKNEELKLLSGGKESLERTIRSVEIMEVPDGVYWAKEGDFTITTGYCIGKGDISLEYVVKHLVESNAAGLAIKLGRFIDKIPAKILDYANKNNFPIIQIPNTFSYRRIMEPILDKLRGFDRYNRYLIDEARTKMMGLWKNGYEIEDISILIESILNCRTYIFSDFKNMRTLLKEDVNSKIVRELILKNKSKIYKEKEYLNIRDNMISVYIFNLYDNKNIIGNLAIEFKKDKKELNNTELMIINEILPFISIAIMNNQKKISQGFKDKEEFYLSVLEGYYKDNDLELIKDANNLKVSLDSTRIVIILNFTNYKDLNQKLIENRIKLNIEKDLLRLEYIVPYRDKLILIIETRYNDEISLHREYEKIIGLVEEFYQDCNISLGISKVCESMKYLGYAYEEALFALDFGRKLDLNKKVYYYCDYIVNHMLTHMKGHPIVSKMYKNTIEILKEYDLENNSELVETLRVYLKNDLNNNKTAEELFIHRNTLYMRLNKIEEVTGMDLNDSENLLLTQLGFKIEETK